MTQYRHEKNVHHIIAFPASVDDSGSAKSPPFEQEKLVWMSTLNVIETIVAPGLFQGLLYFR